jgi:conjugal transfer/entry exclusion protein
MAKVTAAQKAAAEAQAAELKATAVLEANEAAPAAEAQANTRRFRDGSIRRCSSSRS